MDTYKTSEIAAIFGVHPNTVRLYEKLGLIPEAERLPNGYRIFTAYHIDQFRLARTAFQVEVLQNGLRKKSIEVVKASAAGDFDRALSLALEYVKGIQRERRNAEEAVENAEKILAGKTVKNTCFRKRKEISEYLDISTDTLRSWEMNGLIRVKRRKNGYRIYSEGDVRRLRIIRSLRCANYSLEAILRMLCKLEENSSTDMKEALNVPEGDEDVIAVCDRLILSLAEAEENGAALIQQLEKMKTKY